MLPYFVGIFELSNPNLWAFFKISQGYYPVLSNPAATGIISSLVNLRARSWIAGWVSLKVIKVI